MPCGREDGKNSQDEMPYEIKIRKKGKYLCAFNRNLCISHWEQFEGNFSEKALVLGENL